MSCPRVFHQADAASPEAACRVAFTVVESIGRVHVWLRVDKRRFLAGLWVEADKTSVARIDEICAFGWHDGAYALADIPGLFGTCFWIEADDLVVLDIDVKQ